MLIKTIKVMLIPNNKQNTKLFGCAGAARFAYNWALARVKENYENGMKFVDDKKLRKEFNQLKEQEEYKWLNQYSNNIPKQAIRDLVKAFKKFFQGKADFPQWKAKRHSVPSFYVDTSKIKFDKSHVKLEKIVLRKKKNRQKLNFIKLAEKDNIPTDCNYVNPRVKFDGQNWYITVGISYVDLKKVTDNANDGIGIDVGIKDSAICSDGNVSKNINKTKEVKRVKKKINRLQKQVSRKYERNKKGESYCKTKNIIKVENEINKLYKRLTGIRDNHFHTEISKIINRKPKFITIEDLNISGMMKNKHLSKAVQEQKLYTFRQIITYQCIWNHIELRLADRFYPSSKKCSCCGNIKKDLKLKDRVYKCDVCGLVIDRDFNASINLKNCDNYEILN